jgi:hypothetical protein
MEAICGHLPSRPDPIRTAGEEAQDDPADCFEGKDLLDEIRLSCLDDCFEVFCPYRKILIANRSPFPYN